MDKQTQTKKHNLDPQQIAAQMDRDRALLANSITALRDRLTVDSLWGDAVAVVKRNAAPGMAALDHAIRANPLAVGLTAVGLAWLILGRRSQSDGEPPLAGTKFEAITRWEDEGGPVSPEAEPQVAFDEDWVVEADGIRQRAAALVAQIDHAARNRLAPATDLARHRAEVLAALPKDVAKAMSRGLGAVTETARAKTLEARQAAYAARIAATSAGARTVRANPGLTGVILAAAGATLAALLPQTRLEHQVLGPARDLLVEEAKRVLQDPRIHGAVRTEPAPDPLV